MRIRYLTDSRLGIRGSALLLYGLWHLSYSIRQVWPTDDWLRRGDVRFRSEYLEPRVFGYMWAAVGVLCVATALSRSHDDSIGWAATVWLFSFWACTSLGAQFLGEARDGWAAACTWGFTALIALVISRAEYGPPPGRAKPGADDTTEGTA